MKINCSKTQLMFLNPSKEQRASTINLDNNSVSHQEHIKILGFTLSSDLKWDMHLKKGKSNMIKSINAKNAMLRSIRNIIPMKELALVANNLINSTIVYGAPLWVTTTKENKNIIQRSQTKSARIVLASRWQDGNKMHRQNLFDKLKWPNVQQIAEAALLNLVKRATSGQASHGLKNMFKKVYPRHPRGLETFTIQHGGDCKRKPTNFTAYATTEFNKLPDQLRDPKMSCKKFKREIKTHLKMTLPLTQHINEKVKYKVTQQIKAFWLIYAACVCFTNCLFAATPVLRFSELSSFW